MDTSLRHENSIRFTYAMGAAGTVRELANWEEFPKYLVGVDLADHRVKTFRKDRVLEYLDGAAARLSEPFPEPAVFESDIARPIDQRPHVIFTGFAKVQRASLEARAEVAGMRVCKTVTLACMYLVAGPNAGPAKVADARAKSSYILSEPQFLALLGTGVLPDNPDVDGSQTDC